jgi:hypothetical protein
LIVAESCSGVPPTGDMPSSCRCRAVSFNSTSFYTSPLMRATIGAGSPFGPIRAYH